jgi:hypothetical protein
VSALLGAGVVSLLLLLASPAPAADTDLTPAAIEARKAVGLPAIEANPASEPRKADD